MSTYITKYARENGLKKVDAKSNLLVTLNQTDISRSKMKDSKNCAFAHACKRQLDGVKKAFFFTTTAWLEYEGKLVRYSLPPSVQKEIVSFDRSGLSETGIYHLAKPSETMAVQNKRSKARAGRHMPGKTGRKQPIRHSTTNIRSLAEPK